jgi:hypothetical protein
MKFQYIGDGNDSPLQTKLFGHAFALKGEAVEVTDPRFIKKLIGNKTFLAVEGKEMPEITEETPPIVKKKGGRPKAS